MTGTGAYPSLSEHLAGADDINMVLAAKYEVAWKGSQDGCSGSEGLCFFLCHVNTLSEALCITSSSASPRRTLTRV